MVWSGGNTGGGARVKQRRRMCELLWFCPIHDFPAQAGYLEARGADRPIGYLGILRKILVPLLGGTRMVAEMHTSEQQPFAWHFPAVLHLSDGVQRRG